MKKFFVLASLGLMLSASAMAEQFTSGDFTYVTNSDNTVEAVSTTLTDGEMIIPETVTYNNVTYTVTSIGENFCIRQQITSLKMPNTIKKVGSQAFQFCMALTSVHLSESLETIGASAFQTTRKLVEINWPTSLKTIHKDAFYNMTNYAGQIWLPKGISVDNNAFAGNWAATSLWLDGQPSEWGINICEGYQALTKMYVNCMYPPKFNPAETFPEDDFSWDDPVPVTLYVPVGARENYLANQEWVDFFEDIIESDIFTNPDKTNPDGPAIDNPDREYETYTNTWSDDFTVAKLNVAEAGTLSQILGDHKATVKTIALSGQLNGTDILCLRNMAGVTLDGSVIKEAVLESIDLTNAEIVAGGDAYYSYKDTYYTEPDQIGPMMFSYCYSLKNFVMPKYAEVIGKDAFDHTPIVSIELSPALKSIGETAFYGCEELVSIDIPDGCSQIDDMAFYTCYGLKSAHLPESITTIPFALFYFCHSLESVNIPESVKVIEELAFHQCKSLKTVSIPAATYMLYPTSFGLCTSLEAFTVAEENENYTAVDGVLFNKNKTKLILYPAGKKDTEYTVPTGTISIEEMAMFNSSFTTLNISEGVNKLVKGSISYCQNLQSVSIPSTVVSLEDVFGGCGAICNYFVAEGNPEYADIEGVLCNAEKSYLMKYPAGRTEQSYVVPAPVKEIGEEAFVYCSTLKELSLSEGVESIGLNAFAYCTALEEANFPSTLKYIDEGAFGYTKLQKIDCPAVVPPVCEYNVYEDGVGYPFVGVDAANCKLYVPADSIEDYRNDQVWSMFDIMAISGVETVVTTDSEATVMYFDINGLPVDKDAKGIVIVRTSDGRTCKIVK